MKTFIKLFCLASVFFVFDSFSANRHDFDITKTPVVKCSVPAAENQLRQGAPKQPCVNSEDMICGHKPTKEQPFSDTLTYLGVNYGFCNSDNCKKTFLAGWPAPSPLNSPSKIIADAKKRGIIKP